MNMPTPDLTVSNRDYYNGATVVMHARKESGFEQVYNTHLPNPAASINGKSYYANYQISEVVGRATIMGELTKNLPPLPDNAVNLDTARYGRACYDKAKVDFEGRQKTIIDLNEVAMKGLHDTYVAKFGPLPEEIMMNDILSHIHDLIKEA